MCAAFENDTNFAGEEIIMISGGGEEGGNAISVTAS